MWTHRKDYKLYKDGKRGNITSFILFDKYGIDNCKIVLVEEVECKSKEDLHKRERYYIENNECVNKYIPGRTRKETQKEYRDANKEIIKEKNNERIICDICFKEMNRSSLRLHKKNIHNINLII
jgi:hypothetical protein